MPATTSSAIPAATTHHSNSVRFGFFFSGSDHMFACGPGGTHPPDGTWGTPFGAGGTPAGPGAGAPGRPPAPPGAAAGTLPPRGTCGELAPPRGTCGELAPPRSTVGAPAAAASAHRPGAA